MGTISDKLTYLNDTKQLLKENINNLGGNLTNEPFRQYASVLEGIYERIPKVSGIGASLSLSPSLMGKIKLNEIQGNTLQQNTPTPSSPVPIQSVTGLQNVEVCGKNLLDLDYTSQTINGVTFTINEDKSITLNGTSTSSFSLYDTQPIKLKAGTYTHSSNQIQNGIYISLNNVSTTMLNGHLGNTIKTFTISEDTTYQRYLIYIDSGKTFNNYNLKLQLEKGSTATSYEPYKGNTYEVNLGKNLFDKTKDIIDGQTFGPSGELLNNSNFFYQNFYIPVTPNTTYTVSKTTGSNSLRICEYDSSKTFIKRNYEKQTITTSATTYFIRISNYKLQIDAIQLEKGTQATSYSPYFTPIELNKIGDYKDSIKKSTGKNLFDKDNITTGKRLYYWQGTAELIDDANYCVSDYIKIKPNTIYTINLTMSAYTRMIFFDNNKNPLSANETNATFTTPNNTAYVRLSVPLNQLNTTQLEENSQITSYEPYGKVWYITKNIGKVVLDGSESDSTYNTGTTGSFTRFGYLPFMSTDVCKAQSNYVSNYFKYLGTIGGDTTEAGISNTSISGLNRLFIFLPTSTASTIAQFKTWLTTHNTEILYQLATPTYTVITNTELIEQLESLNNAKSKNGTTNINVTSEDLSMILNVNVIKGDA